MAHEQLISESIRPLFGGDATDSPVVAGEPLVPQALVWRGTTYPVLAVLQTGRGLGPCTHGSGERYVRKHWYRFATTGGLVLRVYFERRARTGSSMKRWWLFSIEDKAGPAESGQK